MLGKPGTPCQEKHMFVQSFGGTETIAYLAGVTSKAIFKFVYIYIYIFRYNMQLLMSGGGTQILASSP